MLEKEFGRLPETIVLNSDVAIRKKIKAVDKFERLRGVLCSSDRITRKNMNSKLEQDKVE
jgi:hypothetical protein